jgi:Anti-sigma factor NepR
VSGKPRDKSEKKQRAPVPADRFDSWLDAKLKTAYGSVLGEPIPDDILKLLEQELAKKLGES